MNNLKDNYVLRSYQVGDEKEIVELLQLAFDGWPRFDLTCASLDHWQWKYVDSPLKPHSPLVCLAGFEDKIIGTEHTLPLKIKVGDEIVLCGHTGDIAVHPKSRGKGLSGELMKMSSKIRKEARIHFSYAETRNPLLIKSRSREITMKEFPISVTHIARIRDIEKHLRIIHSDNVWIKKLGLNILKQINNLNVLIRTTTSRSAFNISKVDLFDNNIDRFWKKIKDNYMFIVEKNRDYLNWRYCDPRGGNYRIKKAEHEGDMLGYIVLRIDSFEKEYPRGYIVDLLTLPERLDVANALTEDAVKYFDSQGVNIINYCGVKNHPYEKVLKKHNFINIGFKIYLYYDPITLTLDDIGKMPPHSLHFVYGNTDWI